MSSLARHDRGDWQGNAACLGEMGVAFYPPLPSERRSNRTAREARAKRICAGCEVRIDCLDHALAVGERYGIWGGLTESERKHLHA